MTNTIDARMRYCALALQDQALLVKLSAFDVMEEDHAKISFDMLGRFI